MSDDPITAAITTAVESATPEPEVAADDPIPGDEDAAPQADEPAPEAPAPDADPNAEAAQPGEEVPAAEPPKKKRGPIPYDRHEAVLTKHRREAEAKQQELQARLESLSRYESEEHKAQLQFLDLLQNDPARAVAILRQVDEQRFGRLSWAEQQAEAAAAAAAASTAAPASPNGEMPQPDRLFDDGTLGYTAEGAQKLLEWRMAEERAERQKELKALRDEISPIKSEREAREAYSQALTRTSKKLSEARDTWPEFKSYEKEMRAALEANPTWQLEEAYRAVVVPKLQVNREAIRAEERKRLIDEMNAKSKARPVAAGQLPAAGATPSDQPRDLEDVIRGAIRSAA